MDNKKKGAIFIAPFLVTGMFGYGAHFVIPYRVVIIINSARA